MRGEPFHLLQSLDLGILQESLVIGIHGASIHEILPDQDAQRVTIVEEILGRIDATAPDAEHVEMGILGFEDQLLRVFRIHPGLDHLLRDIVGAFGVHRHPIDLKIEGEALLIRLLNHLESLDTSADMPRIQQFAIVL